MFNKFIFHKRIWFALMVVLDVAVSNCNSHSASSEDSSLASPAGLANVGNTCFMNSSLQIIAALYADKLKDGPLKDIIDKINTPVQSHLDGKGSHLNREDIKNFIEQLSGVEKLSGRVKEMVTSGQQEDAVELIMLMNEVWRFLCDLKGSIYAVLEDKEGKGSVPLEGWESPMLMMPYIKDQSLDLSGMIRSYPYPGEDAAPLKRLFHELPESLAICLQRAEGSGGKVLDSVPGTMHITIQLGPKQGGAVVKFDLSGCIVHQGDTSHSGHYVAYVKRKGKWYKTNDTSITEIPSSAVAEQSQQACLWFYKRA